MTSHTAYVIFLVAIIIGVPMMIVIANNNALNHEYRMAQIDCQQEQEQ